MKRVLLIMLLMCVCSIQAQIKQVKVTQKNNVVVKGYLKEVETTDHVIVMIAGMESNISMANIESIGKLDNPTSIESNTESIDGFKQPNMVST